MKVNGVEIIGKMFGYDGCHKIYIIEDKEDFDTLVRYGYDILPIEVLPEIYEKSCPLRFIDNAKLTKQYVPQCEDATFSE